jgi:hypothetical protein
VRSHELFQQLRQALTPEEEPAVIFVSPFKDIHDV